MTELSADQQKTLKQLEQRVSVAWARWLKAYDHEVRAEGVAVKVDKGSRELKLWEELCALRAERNELLEQFRSSGINI